MKLYFIERFNEESQFEGSVGICEIDGKIYDIVNQQSGIGLLSISDHIFDMDSKVLEKTNPREEAKIKAFIESKYGPVNELLLG